MFSLLLCFFFFPLIVIGTKHKRLTRGEQIGKQAENLKMAHAWTELNALKYGQRLTSRTTASLFVNH